MNAKKKEKEVKKGRTDEKLREEEGQIRRLGINL